MSGEKRDYKAEFGSQPTWELQREKQEEVATNFYENRDQMSEREQQYREEMGSE